MTGGRESFLPARRPKMLPISSTVTARSSSLSQLTNRSRALLSSSDRARRCTPPAGVAPILAISSRLARRRPPFTRSLVASKRPSKVVDFLGDSVAARAEFRQHPLPLLGRSWYNRKIVMYRRWVALGWLALLALPARPAGGEPLARSVPGRKACCSPSWATSWRTT